MGPSQQPGGTPGPSGEIVSKSGFRKCALGFGKREKPADRSGASFSDMKETHKIFCKGTAPSRVRCVSSQTFAKRAGAGGLLCDLCTPGAQESPEDRGSQDCREGWGQTRDGPDGVRGAGRGGRARQARWELRCRQGPSPGAPGPGDGVSGGDTGATEVQALP